MFCRCGYRYLFLYLHRCQTHRSITFNPLVEHFMRFWLWVRTAMPTREWVAVHRCHHANVDSDKDPHQQFIFSASGLTTQALINEGILDIPHDGGGPIERGLLAGGIGTTLFYITLGRNASVSDITYMARTSSLSKTQVSLIFGGVSAIQALRISRDPKYDHFFVRPAADGLRIGMSY